MKHSGYLIAGLLLLAACAREAAVNPDSNHTHADFAIWTAGERMDFSGEEFMSGSSQDAEHLNAIHTYLHLHDGNGDVVHRHKPGLMFGEFMVSNLGLNVVSNRVENTTCLVRDKIHALGETSPIVTCISGNLRAFVNGKEVPAFDIPEYVFNDVDMIFLTDSTDETVIQNQLSQLTDDACLYSRTCPWRGDPPTENCIADPSVPCVE